LYLEKVFAIFVENKIPRKLKCSFSPGTTRSRSGREEEKFREEVGFCGVGDRSGREESQKGGGGSEAKTIGS
jgi:hypothetical protein